ncbi:sugar phosphate isomerase/epimerase [Paenibacillus rhizovicinus]|uniref:Sugar phosphate isomerase/epimerase n=1 Tax=Paenibacillus rhizovicinus TaxID=2704463 RepID=A0A6C0NTD5_9BACL|nr:sugar phosphate isomerase/epimerase family protein [Paenibacillus rhizovicinus]QHW29371.1 sugar phosphate isomerase/epimerase [Paenibacillus rhizovicinus]
MITIYDWFGYNLTVKERYRLIKEVGFEGILLWWSDGFGRDCFGSGDYLNGPQLAREAGLFIENIHVPVHNQNSLWSDDLAGSSVYDCYLQCVTDCVEYEIPTMVVHLPKDDYPYTALGLDRVKRIAEKAEQLGINVALENVKNFANLAYVLNQVDSRRIGFCYDCGHHYRNNSDIDILSMYGSRLMALHLHDNNGSHSEHGLPFDGTVDWFTTMKKIAETGYSGAIAIEAMNWDYEALSAKQFLETAFERAIRLESLTLQLN